MNRESGSEHPSQRTVAELLAEYGGGSDRNARKRRRRAEDPTETAPQAIIERVLSDSGRMRPIAPDEEPPSSAGGAAAPGAAPAADSTATRPPGRHPANAGPPAAGPPVAGGPPPGPAAGPPAGQVAPLPGPPGAPPADPSTPQSPPQPQGAEEAGRDQDNGGTNFWSRRFAAAGSGPPAQQAEPANAADGTDPEVTAQQPVVHRPTPYPRQGPGQTPQAFQEAPGNGNATGSPAAGIEGKTEKLSFTQTEAGRSAGGGATALLGSPQGSDAAEVSGPQDPYDFDAYARSPGDDGYADYGADGYDPELPAGMDAEDYRSATAEEDAPETSPGKEWFVLAGQGAVGLLAGGVVWVGFRWLWNAIPLAALVAALVVTGCLVFIARKILRTDDLQTILLAVLVGLICTVSPAALLLIGQ